MIQRKTEKEEIALEARLLLKQSEKTKQEIFEILVNKYKYSKDVAEVLRYIPSPQAIAKYGVWNTALLVFLIFIALFFIVIGFPVGLVWYGLSIYVVASKKTEYYMWVSVLFSIVLIGLVAGAISSPDAIFYWKNIVILTLTIPSCFLPIWLQIKLCPKPTERKEIYINPKGERRMRFVYDFPDDPAGAGL